MIINKLIIQTFRLALKIKCLQNGVKRIVTELYKGIALDDLHIKTEVVKVKKGKARYTLVFFATNGLRTKVNIGRHKDPFSATC